MNFIYFIFLLSTNWVTYFSGIRLIFPLYHMRVCFVLVSFLSV